MRGFAGYLLIGSLAAVAMALTTVTGLDLAVGARPLAARGELIQHVDRTHKGNRLDIHATIGVRPLPPLHKQPAKMLMGCEPAYSPLAAAAPANTSGRCLAALPRGRTMAG
jgi:hypothetical protein